MMWTTQPRFEIGNLATIKAGNGPALVMIHGVGLRAEAWGGQIAAMSADHTIIAPDLPGHGESAALIGDVDLAGYCEALAAILPEKCSIVGHSMGAMIAIELAAAFPDRVQAVCAMNGIYRRSDAAKTAVQARANALSESEAADPSQTLDRWFGPSATPERQACDAWLSGVNPQGYKAAYSVFAHHDGPSDRTLQKIQCPALFMTGSLEPNSTPQMSDAMARKTTMGKALIVEGAAHMLPMTHPNLVSDALRSFVAENVRAI